MKSKWSHSFLPLSWGNNVRVDSEIAIELSPKCLHLFPIMQYYFGCHADTKLSTQSSHWVLHCCCENLFLSQLICIRFFVSKHWHSLNVKNSKSTMIKLAFKVAVFIALHLTSISNHWPEPNFIKLFSRKYCFSLPSIKLVWYQLQQCVWNVGW